MHPILRLINLVHKIDDDPQIANRIHTFGFWYWTANFPIVVYLFVFESTLWAKWGLFITLVYSIYANWTSDYTGMSASQSVLEQQKD